MSKVGVEKNEKKNCQVHSLSTFITVTEHLHRACLSYSCNTLQEQARGEHPPYPSQGWNFPILGPLGRILFVPTVTIRVINLNMKYE